MRVKTALPGEQPLRDLPEGLSPGTPTRLPLLVEGGVRHQLRKTCASATPPGQEMFLSVPRPAAAYARLVSSIVPVTFRGAPLPSPGVPVSSQV
ncbi:hypothetical protein GCM10010207_31290 [Streptomyces atratus]|nr:hypothetical protein GCM10010207_31290 [Streptomyces atratus]